MSELKQKHCVPCHGGTPKVDRHTAESLLSQAKGWATNNEATEIARTYNFKNFYETMTFANAIAWIVNREDHHPDLEISYKRCHVRYSTHAVHGLTENDFICAAKINDLFGD
ncbi:MAG: 4a-hydroxytetrahydrobiopterin dehydratase [Gammaproteobacteria bacterium]|nr:4a-hydroxytetrahydrobiopterin dehydratase [Gammaproteobacteria bacterium]